MNETHSLHEVKGKDQGQVKFHHIIGHEGTEVEQRCTSTLSLTSTLDGMGGQRYAPAPGSVCTGAENLAPTGIHSPDRPARS